MLHHRHYQHSTNEAKYECHDVSVHGIIIRISIANVNEKSAISGGFHFAVLSRLSNHA